VLLLDTPACFQLSLLHDSALPVDWIHQVCEGERGGVRRGMDGRIRRQCRWRQRGSGAGRWTIQCAFDSGHLAVTLTAQGRTAPARIRA